MRRPTRVVQAQQPFADPFDHCGRLVYHRASVDDVDETSWKRDRSIVRLLSQSNRPDRDDRGLPQPGWQVDNAGNLANPQLVK
jgi:hypothetical protein